MNRTVLLAGACVTTMSFSVSLASPVEVSSQAAFRNQRQTYSGMELRRFHKFSSPGLSPAEAVPSVAARPVSARRAALEKTAQGQTLIRDARLSLAAAVERHDLGKLVALRLKAGLSQKQLCEAAGIPQPHLSRLENGHVGAPDTKTLAKLAGVLGVSLDDIADAFSETAVV